METLRAAYKLSGALPKLATVAFHLINFHLSTKPVMNYPLIVSSWLLSAFVTYPLIYTQTRHERRHNELISDVSFECSLIPVVNIYMACICIYAILRRYFGCKSMLRKIDNDYDSIMYAKSQGFNTPKDFITKQVRDGACLPCTLHHFICEVSKFLEEQREYRKTLKARTGIDLQEDAIVLSIHENNSATVSSGVKYHLDPPDKTNT
jgi:hypothetical protein